MSGGPNAKRIINEGNRDAMIDLCASLQKLCNLTAAFDLDLVEAMFAGNGNGNVDQVAKSAMDADATFASAMKSFEFEVLVAAKSYGKLRKDLDLG